MSAPSPIRISLDRVAATIVDCDPDVRSRLALITIESVRVTPVLITLFAFQGFLPCNAQNTSVTLNSATVTHRIVTSGAFSKWLKMQTWPTFCQFWPVFPEKLVLLLSTRAANVSERILIRNTLCFCKLLFATFASDGCKGSGHRPWLQCLNLYDKTRPIWLLKCTYRMLRKENARQGQLAWIKQFAPEFLYTGPHFKVDAF